MIMKLTKSFEIEYYRYPHAAEPERSATKVYSHTYRETWEFTEYFCPHCGKLEIWHETGGGDYYVGEQFICLDCHFNFTFQDGGCIKPAVGNESDVQRLAKLIG